MSWSESESESGSKSLGRIDTDSDSDPDPEASQPALDLHASSMGQWQWDKPGGLEGASGPVVQRPRQDRITMPQERFAGTAMSIIFGGSRARAFIWSI